MIDPLKQLKLQNLNAGACFGPHHWYETNGAVLSSINPSDETQLAQIKSCDINHYEKVIQQAQYAFNTWRDIPAPKRGELIRLIGAKVRQQKDGLGTLISLENGKIKAEGDGEIQEIIDMADFAVGQSRMLYGKTMHSERPAHRMYEQWLPLGVVGVITAFNFPMAVWAWNAFLAAIAGNTVVWKPSSQTPLCAIALQHLCNEAMVELGFEGVFSLLIGPGQDIGNRLAEDRRIALISFTGSCRQGQQVHVAVAQRMAKVLLELGGNNAIIVDESADLDLALRAIVFGAVGTAGQRCTSTRRLILHEKIAVEFMPRLINAYRQISLGNPLSPQILMGPLINPMAVERYLHTLEVIKKTGGKILYGGERLPGKGFFVKPTLVEFTTQTDIMQQETFAPILYCINYSDLSQAIALNNEVSQGLSSALFTRNLQHAEYFLSAAGSDCGIANINIGTSGAEIGGAFGGEKSTGGGREAGSDAWQAYMRRQTNTINWGTQMPLAQGIRFETP